jgi:hypothetical protein
MNVSCDFLGRTGNLLFQVAAMIGYTSKHGGKWGIPVGYRHKTIYNYWPHLPLYRGEAFYRRRGPLQVWSEPDFSYTEIPKHDKGVKLHGFFQSLKYFEHCQDEVRHWIRLKETPIERVGIHVRRGDYLQYPDRFPTVTEKYLEEAINYFMYRGYAKFLVFSDDIGWCKELFKDWGAFKDSFQFSEGRNEYEDLSLMASCEHQIIANSSFSWMAAWYNTNKNKIVISPSKETWFGDGSDLSKNDLTRDLLPKEWIQIHTR